MFRIKILIVPAIVGVAMVITPTNPVLAQAQKITICHIDQETQELQTIRIGVGAQAAHDRHGDDLDGPCPGPKVEICHSPPGNPDKMFTLLVDEAEVGEHTDPIDGHGDTLGPC